MNARKLALPIPYLNDVSTYLPSAVVITIRPLLKLPWVGVTENDAGSALRCDEDVAQVGSDGWRVLVSHRFYDPLELEIRQSLAVVLDVDLS